MLIQTPDAYLTYPWHERRWRARVRDDFYDRFLPWIGEGVHHRAEPILDMEGRSIGAELLVASTSLNTSVLLQDLMDRWATFNLFAVGIMRAFDILDKWVSCFVSVNAYLSDIGHPDFRYFFTKLRYCYTQKQRSMITVELLEYPYGNINGKFIDNVAWLRAMWYRVKIDDLDVLGIDKMGVSKNIAEAVDYDGVKLDHTTTRLILNGSLSAQCMEWIRVQLRRMLPPYGSLTAEWVHSQSEIAYLGKMVWVTEFQIAPKKFRDPDRARRSHRKTTIIE